MQVRAFERYIPLRSMKIFQMARDIWRGHEIQR